MKATRSAIASAFAFFLTLFVFAASPPAFAQDAIDTTKIARLPNSKELFAFPQSTSYTTSLSVPEALMALSTLLVNDKWQPYEQAFASQSTTANLAIVNFKKDRELLSVMIAPAPAQNNATGVSYTALVPGHDLPFPNNASAVKYDPTRPYLSCSSAAEPESLSLEMRKGLQERGWQPWSPKDAKRVANGDQKTDGGGITAYYVHASEPSLHLSIGKREDGQTTLTVEAISAEVLAAVGKAPSDSKAEANEAEPKAEQAPKADVDAAKTPDQMDELAGQIMDQARSAIDEALSGNEKPSAKKNSKTASDAGSPPLAAMASNDVDAAIPVPLPEGSEDISLDNDQLEFSNSASVVRVAAFYRSALKEKGWKERRTPINKPNVVVLQFDKSGSSAEFTIMRMGDHTQVTGTGAAFEAAATKSDGEEAQAGASADDEKKSIMADQLQPDEAAGLPVPKQSTSKGSEKTMFRVSALADVEAPLQAVLEFYRRELGKRTDWQMQNEATDSSGSARVQYATPEGPAVLTLTEKSGTTSIVLLVRKKKEAQASGLMPKPGQVRILIGNILEKDAEISFAKKTIKVGAGKGAKAPDGPTLEIKPGSYAVNVKSPGLNASPETITVGADEIWGLMIGPGGILALPMY